MEHRFVEWTTLDEIRRQAQHNVLRVDHQKLKQKILLTSIGTSATASSSAGTTTSCVSPASDKIGGAPVASADETGSDSSASPACLTCCVFSASLSTPGARFEGASAGVSAPALVLLPFGICGQRSGAWRGKQFFLEFHA